MFEVQTGEAIPGSKPERSQHRRSQYQSRLTPQAVNFPREEN